MNLTQRELNECRRIQALCEAKKLFVNDDSIDTDSAKYWCVFSDKELVQHIQKMRKEQSSDKKEIIDAIKAGEVKNAELIKALGNQKGQTAAIIGSQLIGSAANAGAQIATNPQVLATIAAMLGYKKLLNGAKEAGENLGWELGQKYAEHKYKDENARLDKQIFDMAGKSEETKKKFLELLSGTNLTGGSKAAQQMDLRAAYIADQINNDKQVKHGNKVISREDAMKWITDHGYSIRDNGKAERTSKWTDPSTIAAGAGTATAAATAAGAAGSSAAGAGAAAGTAAGAAEAGVAGAAGAAGTTGTIFGMSIGSFAAIAGGVVAAAAAAPYIWDKTRAFYKKLSADIIAKCDFESEGVKYTCYYDLKRGSWILTYANVKFTTYLGNKLPDETIQEFAQTKFFRAFSEQCRKYISLVIDNTNVSNLFKIMTNIKNTDKKMKKIIKKIFTNKGQIRQNMFKNKFED